MIVENDGNVAAWAEFRYGAARDADDSMIMFTVGTGIGGGIVLGGELSARRPRHRRRAGPHARRPGRPPVRLRPARAAWSSTPAATPWCGSPRPARGRSRSRAALCWSWPAATPTAITGPMVTAAAQARRRGRAGRFAQIGRWLGISAGRHGADPRPADPGGRRRRDRRRRPAARARPGRRTSDQLAQRGRLPVAEVRAAGDGQHGGVVGAADLARRI